MSEYRRILAPLSAGLTLLVALSACSTSTDNGSESSAAAGTSSQSAANNNSGKLPVGLTEDNKAGDTRPRSKTPEVIKGAQVNSDGSWTYTKDDGTKMITNADGTWSITNEKKGIQATLNPDGSWERTLNNEARQRQARVNADGTWTLDDRKLGHFETHADGSWKKTHGSTESIGKADGTATIKDANGERDLPKRQWPTPPALPELPVSVDGVGGDSVLPLQPRKGLTVGSKVVYVVPDSEEAHKATAEQEGLLLTDENKAGKPRPRSEHQAGENIKVEPDGSWVAEVEGVTTTVKADGTWTQKKANGNTASLHADGSWDEYFADRDEAVRVNPDGSWTWIYKGGENDAAQGERKITVNADGSWRNESPSYVSYGTADGKVYQEKPKKQELNKNDTPKGLPYIPTAQSPAGPGGGGVVPLSARAPLKAGQKIS